MPEACEGTSETTAVRDAHKFDLSALDKYLRDQLPSFGSLTEVRQFAGGQSNPTFLLKADSLDLVLRKKPPGELLASAHQIEREYQIIKALQDTDVPVPKVHLLCSDASVIGTPFYLMDCIKGRIFRDPKLPECSPKERGEIYRALAETLGHLHRVNWESLGLNEFGKRENFLRRQIKRWSGQFDAAKDVNTDNAANEAMHSLSNWLETNIPADDAAGENVTIVHGDYRLENLIFHPSKPEVLAIIDWELSTIGHPLSDLGYCCVSYHLPASIEGLPGLQGLDFSQLGIPAEEELLHSYCATTGSITSNHNYFVAFSFFRLASIAQGIRKRAAQGTASSAKAEAVGKLAALFAKIGWQITNYA